MAPACSVVITNVTSGGTISTPANPPFFRVAVNWSNPFIVDGTVTLTATNGVTISPSSHPATAASVGQTCYFSLSSPNSVSGVTLTAKIASSVSLCSDQDLVDNVTVTVT